MGSYVRLGEVRTYYGTGRYGRPASPTPSRGRGFRRLGAQSSGPCRRLSGIRARSARPRSHA